MNQRRFDSGLLGVVFASMVIALFGVLGLATVDTRTEPPEPERPDSHVAWWLSGALVIANSGSVAVAALVGATRAVTHLANARRARRSAREASKLAAGPQVLSGTAAPLDGREEIRVRIDVVQQGEEHTDDSGKSLTWTEIERTLVAEPFSLDLDSGVRIIVEPMGRVAFADELDVVTRTSKDRRRRSAVLDPGEAVHVVGELLRGSVSKETDMGRSTYRDSPQARWVLRPPALGRMLVSTKPPALDLARKAAVHRNGALAMIALSLAIVGVHLGYERRVTSGYHASLPVTDQRAIVVNAPDQTMNYELTVAGDGEPFKAFVLDASYKRFVKGSQAPFVLVRGDPEAAQFGDRPTEHLGSLLLTSILAICGLFAYWAYARSARPWYDRAKLVDTERGSLDAAFRG